MSGRVTNLAPVGSLIKAPKPEKPKRQGIKPRSDKRAAQEKQYLVDREVFLSERPVCEMRRPGCATAASEVHHQRGREGDRLLDQTFWMPACRPCHSDVTDHRGVDPYTAGLSVHRNDTDLRSWEITSTGARPLTVNKVVNLHRMAWATHTSRVRTEWTWLARAARVQPCSAVEIAVRPLHANGRSPQDVGAAAPEAKAAIDGLVDAGLVPDDSPQHVRSLLFLPPAICGEDGMTLLIREVRS